MTLWGGRFEKSPDDFFADFSRSLSFDRRLLPYELRGTKAWAFALVRAGILEEGQAKSIARGLRAIGRRAEEDPSWVSQSEDEDIHTFVQNRLVEEIGEPALRVHTGRSRNDQVALDLRLYSMEAGAQIRDGIIALGYELVRLAERNEGVLLPGFTHLRHAQPILLAHFALAYVEMLLRDLERLDQSIARADVLPLGSGALAGTAFPVDRERLARRLGFSRVSDNSLDAVSDRDFVIDLLSTSSLLSVHLSRLCEDLIVYSTDEFGYVTISDDVSTGSSLMPQKKNPDALELVRGKSGRVIGHLTGLLVTLKGLPMAYNRDLQEDKEPLFDTVETVLSSLRVMQTVVAGLVVHRGTCKAAAGAGFATATDVADYLVRKGLPFRTAHEVVGKVVLQCVKSDHTLETLPLAEYRQVHRIFDEDVYHAVQLEESLAARAVRGGTAPIVVSMALRRAEKRLHAAKDRGEA